MKFFTKLGIKYQPLNQNTLTAADSTSESISTDTREVDNLMLLPLLSFVIAPFLIYNFENSLNIHMSIYDIYEKINKYSYMDSKIISKKKVLINSIINIKDFIQNNLINSEIFKKLKGKIHNIFLGADEMIYEKYKMVIKYIILSFDRDIFL